MHSIKQAWLRLRHNTPDAILKLLHLRGHQGSKSIVVVDWMAKRVEQVERELSE